MSEKEQKKREEQVEKRVLDHEGKEYETLEDMLKRYKIDYSVYLKRKHRGWSLREILTTPVRGYNNINTDHAGNKFKNKAEMAAHYGINENALDNRIYSLGWSLERALTTPVGRRDDGKVCRDHEGKIYPSIRAMCTAYGISAGVYRYRKQQGWDLERILTTKINRVCTVKNSDGKEYNSKTELHRTNGEVYIELSKKKRVRKNKATEKKVVDHKGNEFSSISEMCSFWNMDEDVYRHRIWCNWSIENALTVPVNNKIRSKACVDHKGNKFDSIQEMCKFWGISQTLYTMRRKNNWDLARALTKPVLRGGCRNKHG